MTTEERVATYVPAMSSRRGAKFLDPRDRALESAERYHQNAAAFVLQRRVLKKMQGFQHIHAALTFAWHSCVGTEDHLIMNRTSHASMLRRLFLVEALSKRDAEGMRDIRPLQPLKAERYVEENWEESSRAQSFLTSALFKRFWFFTALRHVSNEKRAFASRIAGWVVRRVTLICAASSINERPEGEIHERVLPPSYGLSWLVTQHANLSLSVA